MKRWRIKYRYRRDGEFHITSVIMEVDATLSKSVVDLMARLVLASTNRTLIELVEVGPRTWGVR